MEDVENISRRAKKNTGQKPTITKSFRYLKWRVSWILFSAILGGGVGFPYITRIHTAYIGEDSSILGTWNADSWYEADSYGKFFTQRRCEMGRILLMVQKFCHSWGKGYLQGFSWWKKSG